MNALRQCIERFGKQFYLDLVVFGLIAVHLFILAYAIYVAWPGVVSLRSIPLEISPLEILEELHVELSNSIKGSAAQEALSGGSEINLARELTANLKKNESLLTRIESDRGFYLRAYYGIYLQDKLRILGIVRDGHGSESERFQVLDVEDSLAFPYDLASRPFAPENLVRQEIIIKGSIGDVHKTGLYSDGQTDATIWTVGLVIPIRGAHRASICVDILQRPNEILPLLANLFVSIASLLIFSYLAYQFYLNRETRPWYRAWLYWSLLYSVLAVGAVMKVTGLPPMLESIVWYARIISKAPSDLHVAFHLSNLNSVCLLATAVAVTGRRKLGFLPPLVLAFILPVQHIMSENFSVLRGRFPWASVPNVVLGAFACAWLALALGQKMFRLGEKQPSEIRRGSYKLVGALVIAGPGFLYALLQLGVLAWPYFPAIRDVFWIFVIPFKFSLAAAFVGVLYVERYVDRMLLSEVLVDSSYEGMLALDVAGRVLYANEAGASLLRSDRDLLRGRQLPLERSQLEILTKGIAKAQRQPKRIEERIRISVGRPGGAGDDKGSTMLIVSAQHVGARGESDLDTLLRVISESDAKRLQSSGMVGRLFRDQVLTSFHAMGRPLAQLKDGLSKIRAATEAREGERVFQHLANMETDIALWDRDLNDVESLYIAHDRPVREEISPLVILKQARELIHRDLIPPRCVVKVDETALDRRFRISVERPRILTALRNLIKNALDASGERGGTVSIYARVDSGKTCRLCVQDSGPGIPELMKSHLGDAYWSSKEGGHGIGLWQAAMIARDHGGKLDATNLQEGGAVFWIELPLAQ